MLKQYRLLSDAILDGAKLAKQARLCLVDAHGNTCALGAAMQAVKGRAPYDEGCNELELLFPLLFTAGALCPVHCCDQYTEGHVEHVMFLIPHLNDHHRWTREQIAGWLSTVEEKLGMVEIVTEPASVKDDVQVRLAPDFCHATIAR